MNYTSNDLWLCSDIDKACNVVIFSPIHITLKFINSFKTTPIAIRKYVRILNIKEQETTAFSVKNAVPVIITNSDEGFEGSVFCYRNMFFVIECGRKLWHFIRYFITRFYDNLKRRSRPEISYWKFYCEVISKHFTFEMQKPLVANFWCFWNYPSSIRLELFSCGFDSVNSCISGSSTFLNRLLCFRKTKTNKHQGHQIDDRAEYQCSKSPVCTIARCIRSFPLCTKIRGSQVDRRFARLILSISGGRRHRCCERSLPLVHGHVSSMATRTYNQGKHIRNRQHDNDNYQNRLYAYPRLTRQKELSSHRIPLAFAATMPRASYERNSLEVAA